MATRNGGTIVHPIAIRNGSQSGALVRFPQVRKGTSRIPPGDGRLQYSEIRLSGRRYPVNAAGSAVNNYVTV